MKSRCKVEVVTILAGLAAVGFSIVLSDVVDAANVETTCLLISPQTPAPVIVIGSDASPSEKFAADEMSAYLEKISGAKVEIVDDSETLDGGAIIAIGRSDLTASEDTSELSCEQFITDVQPGRLTIVGGRREAKPGQSARDAGTLYGVYEFLDSLGVRWYRPESWGEHVPQLSTISLKTGRTISPPPAFSLYRCIQNWGRSPYRETTQVELEQDAVWLARNRMNVYTHNFYAFNPKDNSYSMGSAEKNAQLAAKLGGQEYYEWDHMYRYILPPEDYFESHPEYFALIKGKRDKSDLCLGNPEMQRTFADNLIAKAKQQPDLSGLSIEPSDCLGSTCECDLCKAMDLPLNTQSDGPGSNRVAAFSNIIAGIVAKEAPGVKVVWLAYSSHTATPTNLKQLQPNTIVMIAPINQWSDWTKDLMDSSSSGNADLVRTIKNWVALKPHAVMAWEYYDGYGWPGPLPIAHSVADRWRTYRKLGVKGIFNHSFTSWGPQSMDRYMSMKLAWNPDIDVNAELDLYYKNYYGPAAEPMKSYHEELIHAFKAAKYPVQSGGRGVHLIFTPALVNKLGIYIGTAQQLVEGQPLYERRLKGVRAGYEFARRVSEILVLKKKHGVAIAANTGDAGALPPDLKRPAFTGSGSYLYSAEAEKAYSDLVRWTKSMNSGDWVFDLIRTRTLTEDAAETIYPKGSTGDVGSIWLCYLPYDLLMNYMHPNTPEEILLKDF